MIKYFAKKFIIKQTNNLLQNLKDNQNIEYWKNKIMQIVRFLSNVMEFLDDNHISDEEADTIVEKCKELF